MRSKIIMPLQAFGLGDIIFCMAMATKWYGDGYHVIWGVDEVYLPIAKHFPKVVFIDKNMLNIDYDIKEIKTIGNATIIPIRWSDTIQKVPYKWVMRAKYDMLGLNWQNWKNGFWCDRDYDNERKLFYEVLGLKDGEEYNLISEHFQTGGRMQRKIEMDNGLRNVYMSFIEGFTLFDWLRVMQHATYIHAVASSCIYLFELYEMCAKAIHLYVRVPMEWNHEYYQYLLTKKYVLHDARAEVGSYHS